MVQQRADVWCKVTSSRFLGSDKLGFAYVHHAGLPEKLVVMSENGTRS